MKALPLLLAGSLIANAALVFALNRSVQSSPSARTQASSSLAEARRANASAAAETATDGSAVSPRPTDPAAGPWRALEHEPLEALVARLRAEGCPPAILRAIIGIRVHEEFAARQRELVAGLKETPYWTDKRIGPDPQFMTAYRELRQEESKRLKELLGDDERAEDPIAAYYRRRQFGDIPADKAEEMKQVIQDYGELRSQIFSESGGLLMPEDRTRVAYLEKEMHNDLAQILTPAELESYEMRSSATAQTLRRQLTTFTPTEDEFRALFRAALAVEEQFGAGVITSPEQVQQRQNAFLQAASGSLSPARLAELQQATDPRNQMLNRIVARYDLPTTVVPQVNAVQEDIQQRATLIRTNRSLSAAERTQQLSGLAQEANARLVPLLGERGFEAYQEFGGGWMRTLTRPPPPATVTTPGTPPAAGTAPKG